MKKSEIYEAEQIYIKSAVYEALGQQNKETVTIKELIDIYEEDNNYLKEINMEEFNNRMRNLIFNGVAGAGDFLRELQSETYDRASLNALDTRTVMNILIKQLSKTYAYDAQLNKKVLTKLYDVIIENLAENKAYSTATYLFLKALGFDIKENEVKAIDFQLEEENINRVVKIFKHNGYVDVAGDITIAYRLKSVNLEKLVLLGEDSKMFKKIINSNKNNGVTLELLNSLQKNKTFTVLRNKCKQVYLDVLDPASIPKE